MHQSLSVNKVLYGSVLAVSALTLSACGGSSGTLSSTPIADLVTFDEQAASARSKQFSGPLDPLQDAVVSDIVGGQLASNLPAPLDTGVSCLADAVNSLVDGPDALLAALTDLPNGADPAAAFQAAAGDLTGSLQRFADELQAALAALSGQQDACSTVAGNGSAPNTAGANPLAGTPLETLGDALAQLAGGADMLSGSNEDPELTAVTNLLSTLVGNVLAGFSLIPGEVQQAPVVGALLGTIQTTLVDLRNTLPSVGIYDAVNTQAGIEGLLNNLLDNVLTGVIPVAQIDAATGQNFSEQIQGGIDQLTAQLGSGLGQLITPAFNDGLNGALEPILDPAEGLLAQLLNGDSINGSNPLTGLLSGIAGNGANGPLDALLGLLTFGSSGNGLSDLTAALGGNSGQSPLYQLSGLVDGGTPMDSLLGQLQGATGDDAALGNGLLDGLLGEDGLVGGLLGGLQG
ncbi:MAG: hypothetical protein ACSHXK_03930 [Oceanococcus sp.]